FITALTTQPPNATINSSKTATLSVTATGASLSYQWYQGSSGDTRTPLGVTTRTLTTSPLTSDTSFWVRVTNGSGSVDSDAATITVLPNPTLPVQPQKVWNSPGTINQTSVVASGGTLSYLWYQLNDNGTSTPFTGATQPNFYTPPLDVDGHYWVRVSNSLGS